MNETVEYLEGDRSVISVDVRINNRQFLSRLYASDLVDELQRRNYKHFASHATDSEIEKEYTDRELDAESEINTASDEVLLRELESRDIIFGKKSVKEACSLIDKINQKRATIEEIYTLLEDITGKLICR